MTKLLVINRYTLTCCEYFLSGVRDIDIGKFRDFYSSADIYGNGHKPQDSCIKINFKAGTTASFGKDWFLSFE